MEGSESHLLGEGLAQCPGLLSSLATATLFLVRLWPGPLVGVTVES